jgi:uncharacterized protein YdcH (DUF465 family)
MSIQIHERKIAEIVKRKMKSGQKTAAVATPTDAAAPAEAGSSTATIPAAPSRTVIRSKETYTKIAGERVVPGQPLSRTQMAVIGLAISGGKTYSPEIMEQYNKQRAADPAPVTPVASNQTSRHDFANGGMILGPGTGTSDSIPAFNANTGQSIALSTGEYVLPARVTKAIGKNNLDDLISRADGGIVPDSTEKYNIASIDLSSITELSTKISSYMENQNSFFATLSNKLDTMIAELEESNGTQSHILSAARV